MRVSDWVLAIVFALGLVAVAGWVTLAQDDGKPPTGEAASGTATATNIDRDRVVPSGPVRPVHSEQRTIAQVDLGPLGSLKGLGLVETQSSDLALGDLNTIRGKQYDLDSTERIDLADALNDLDGLVLLDHVAASVAREPVRTHDLFDRAFIGNLSVDDALGVLALPGQRALDRPVASDDAALYGGSDELANLDELDRVDGLKLLDRIETKPAIAGVDAVDRLEDLDPLDLDLLGSLDAPRRDAVHVLAPLEVDDPGPIERLGPGPP
jgi:hypothetical protein